MTDSFPSTESFLPSDDSDEEDDISLYEAIEQGMLAQEAALTLDNSHLSMETHRSGTPTAKPADLTRPKAQRRLSTRVPSFSMNISGLGLKSEPSSPSTPSKSPMSQQTLDNLMEIMRGMPTPPTIQHDAQQTATNLIYNNKITDTAVKLVSGIGKFGKFLSSSTTAAVGVAPRKSFTSPTPPSNSNNTTGATSSS